LIKKYGKSLQRRRISGFTLVELLTVSAIISILAGISFALLSRMRSQVIETNAIAALNMIATGYEMYYHRNNSYPQWGPGERFETPNALWDFLTEEDYIPESYGDYHYNVASGYIIGITEDYALEIPMYNAEDITTDAENSFFIVLHPLNFQRDALAIGINPNPADFVDGWVAVRPRKGKVTENFRIYRLYIQHRGGAVE
jgi:prepilin-type N-terminal cleavage/methylation domain-containing protein